MDFFDLSFWQNFLSNACATFLGAVIGIPVALWIGRIQENAAEKVNKRKILTLLNGEMKNNYDWLRDFSVEEDPVERSADLFTLLRDEMWTAFSDGGELKWIKDPDLLAKLSEAFSMIKIVRSFAERYYYLITTTNNVEDPDMINLLENLSGSVIHAMEMIEAAQKVVNSELNADK